MAAKEDKKNDDLKDKALSFRERLMQKSEAAKSYLKVISKLESEEKTKLEKKQSKMKHSLPYPKAKTPIESTAEQF